MKYYGYKRVSTSTQAEKGQGLDTQDNAIKEYCKANNLVLECIFEDAGIIIDYNNNLIVQDIFGMYAECKNLSEVSRKCEEKEYKTSQGNYFSKQAVSNILKNDFYVGIVTHDGKKYQGEHEPIISKDLFDKVNQQRFTLSVLLYCYDLV